MRWKDEIEQWFQSLCLIPISIQLRIPFLWNDQISHQRPLLWSDIQVSISSLMMVWFSWLSSFIVDRPVFDIHCDFINNPSWSSEWKICWKRRSSVHPRKCRNAQLHTLESTFSVDESLKNGKKKEIALCCSIKAVCSSEKRRLCQKSTGIDCYRESTSSWTMVRMTH